MLRRKMIVAIADGLGDRPHPKLGQLTPLQYANTPHLDRLAAEGISGMMDPIAPGIPVGTDMGHLILFGYEPQHYPGRGPIEALGIGMEVRPGDIVFRCNFATVDDRCIVVDRRAGRIRQGTDALAQALDGLTLEGGVTVRFKQATEHRAVLLLRGEGLSDQVSDSDPKAPNDGMPYLTVGPLDGSEEAARTALAVNSFLQQAHRILSGHPVNDERVAEGKLPANFVLTRGAGRMAELPPLAQERGMRAACIAGESTVLGVARLAGFRTFTDASMTGNLDTNIALKASLAIEQLADHDLVYVHMKAPDVKGHDNDPLGKAQAIERFDELVGRILERLPDDVYVALAADHSTPCEYGEHTGEPVPIVIAGPSVRRDQVQRYSEIDGMAGGLGRLSGADFVRTAQDLLGFVKKLGN